MLDPDTIKRITDLVFIARSASEISGLVADEVVEKSLQAAIKLLEPNDAGSE